MISFNKWMNFMSDCGADLSDLSSASKVFTTWTEFHVITDQLPNIVPWCRIAHRPSVAASAGFPLWCLALIIPSVSKIIPFPLFWKKNAGVLQTGSIRACWIVWQHLKQSGQGHTVRFLCATSVGEASKGLHRQTATDTSSSSVCYPCFFFSQFPLWNQ